MTVDFQWEWNLKYWRFWKKQQYFLETDRDGTLWVLGPLAIMWK